MDKNKLLSEEHLTYAFNFFDKNIMEELLSIPLKDILLMKKIDEAVFRNIYDEIDTNKNGEFDYNEFINMMFGD
jgi:Ca2+-binding EF-hand superfamily protein